MIKFCKKCQVDTDRYKSGGCKPCAKENSRRDKSHLMMARLCHACNMVTERDGSGKCKPCTKAYGAAYSATNPERKKAASAA